MVTFPLFRRESCRHLEKTRKKDNSFLVACLAMKPRKVFQTKNRELPSVTVNGRTKIRQNLQEWTNYSNPSRPPYQKSSGYKI